MLDTRLQEKPWHLRSPGKQTVDYKMQTASNCTIRSRTRLGVDWGSPFRCLSCSSSVGHQRHSSTENTETREGGHTRTTSIKPPRGTSWDSAEALGSPGHLRDFTHLSLVTAAEEEPWEEAIHHGPVESTQQFLLDAQTAPLV